MAEYRTRGTHISQLQKKKLFEFIIEHPKLPSGKFSEGFTRVDAQKLWKELTKELNSLPGPKKAWRAWRKSWQDFHSKAKKKTHAGSDNLSHSIERLQETLRMSTSNNQEANETDQEGDFMQKLDSSVASPVKQEIVQSHEVVDMETIIFEENHLASDQSSEHNQSEEEYSSSDDSYPPPKKRYSSKKVSKSEGNIKKKSKRNKEDHKSDCFFDCDLLAKHEQQKLKLKADFYKFRKDYLNQKLQIMRSQAKSLEVIAKALGAQSESVNEKSTLCSNAKTLQPENLNNKQFSFNE